MNNLEEGLQNLKLDERGVEVEAQPKGIPKVKVTAETLKGLRETKWKTAKGRDDMDLDRKV